jgi:M6 family metalloprotease-like protein
MLEKLAIVAVCSLVPLACSAPAQDPDLSIGTASEALCASQQLTPVSATSSAGALQPASRAIDGNTGTRWESVHKSDPQWIYVDLGARKAINRVVVDWEAANAKDYRIEVSNDASNWTLVALRTNMPGGNHRIDDIQGFAAAGRYVRMYGTARNLDYGYSIWEMRIYGDPSPSCGDVPRVVIQANRDGKFVTLDASGNLLWTASTQGAAQVFEREMLNATQFKLRATSTGKYVVLDGADKLVASADAAGAMAFEAPVCDAPFVGLYATGDNDADKWVASDTGSWMIARSGACMAGNAAAWEKFRLIDVGGISGCGSNALGRSAATASSVENGGTTAALAIDGSTSTRWSSAFSDPQWIRIDLGTTKKIKRVRIDWQTANAKDHRIETSDDGSSWNVLAYEAGLPAFGNHRIDDLAGLSGAGRYVRMYGTLRNTGYGYSIWEMDVYGDNNPACDTGGGGGGPAILSPAAGSALKKTVQTFTWSAGADEYFLRIGSSPGAADLYDSGSLGTATSVTVPKLPLNGRTLFAELKSRVGTTYQTSGTQYTSAVRKGLTVIVDFSNATLEQWTGAGFRSQADVSAMLATMTDHWNWLSRGTESMQWDVMRVTANRPLVADSSLGYTTFRSTLMDQVRQVKNVADYDVNDDGVFDGVWFVYASQGHRDSDAGFGYLSGGTNIINGAGTFADGQSSGSVVGGVHGNFNHELGHCLGLPDLYGTYGTIVFLSNMAASPWLPAPDFSAFDRMKMGWVNPTAIGQTTRGITLRSANDYLEAVKIPTPRPHEYYLVEYRVRPSTGYGSAGPAYNGLVVYHVLEGSGQGVNPPLLKVEPADGAQYADTETGLTDLFYPGNPGMVLPHQVGSYFVSGAVFQIENVQSVSGGMKFDVVLGSPVNDEQPVALANATLETGTSPWMQDAFMPSGAVFDWASIGHASAHSLSVSSPTIPNDARWRLPVQGLVAGQSYFACAWLKGQDIVPYEPLNVGANLTVVNGDAWSYAGGSVGSYDWTKYCVVFSPTAPPNVEIACRLGNFGSTVTGQAWCDDFTMSVVHPAVFQ